MKKIIYLVFPLLAFLLVLGACGSNKDKKICEEISDKLQSKLTEKYEKDITLDFYTKENEDKIFIEENNVHHSKISYGLIDKDTKEIDWLDEKTQSAKDTRNQYIDNGEKIYSEKISIDKK